MRARLSDLKALREKVNAEIAYLNGRLAGEYRGATPTRELVHGTAAGYSHHIRKAVPFPEDTGGKECGCREYHRRYRRWERSGADPLERPGAVGW